jgi:bifunctional DNase/RNase
VFTTSLTKTASSASDIAARIFRPERRRRHARRGAARLVLAMTAPLGSPFDGARARREALHLVTSLALATALWLAAAPPDPDAGVAFAKVTVLDVFELEDGGWAVLLGETGADTVLPIFIGSAEGRAIRLRLDRHVTPRPLTHDLLEDAIAALGGTVVKVEIDDLKADTFLGRIYLRQKSGKTVVLDARPSDSIALALGTGAPIHVARPVLDRAGLSPKNLRRKDAPQEAGPRTESL